MPSNNSDELSDIRGALGSIGLSAVVVLAGSILSQAVGLGTRVIITRYLPIDEYGDFVLGVTVLSTLGVVSIIGLGQAQTRYLPQSETKEERQEVTAAIYQIGIGLAIIWSIIGFMSAEVIANIVFDRTEMINVIRVFSLFLPAYVFYKLSLKGIQGHKETVPNVLTTNFIHPVTRLVSVAVLSLAGFGVIGLSIGYNLAFILGGIAAFLFFLRSGGYQLRSFFMPKTRDRYLELLYFSIPLATSTGFGLITSNTDRFLLGIFKTSKSVGVYDISFLFAQFTLFFGPVLNYLFKPIMAEYDVEGDSKRQEKLYIIITRWLVIVTFPIFTLIVLFPELLLNILFGSKYEAGKIVVSLLATGYFASQFVGLSGSFIIAKGDTNVIMYVSGATAALNLGLNLLLIPIYGILGAAIATVGSTVLNNVLQAIYIYRLTGIHPLTRELLLPIGLGLVSFPIVHFVLIPTEVEFIGAALITSFLSFLLLFWIFITRSVYMTELKLADTILDGIGVPVSLQDRLDLFTRE